MMNSFTLKTQSVVFESNEFRVCMWEFAENGKHQCQSLKKTFLKMSCD